MAPRLANAFDTPDAKRRYVRRLFATIADRYDFITRFLSFGRDRKWKARLIDLAGVEAGWRGLDLACGTGDIAFEAARRGVTVLGIDITHRMVAIARAKAVPADRTAWAVGDMLALPVPDASVHVVTTGYGLRNVPDLPLALAEIHRVLAPGGVMCSLDFDRPEAAWRRTIYLAYLTVIGSSLGWVLHGDPDTYRYIPASIQRYPGSRGVMALMRDAGFEHVRHVPVMGGFMAIHVGRRP
jgi:ubiquinone/menaquinone biosynthesis methyltransferase